MHWCYNKIKHVGVQLCSKEYLSKKKKVFEIAKSIPLLGKIKCLFLSKAAFTNSAHNNVGLCKEPVKMVKMMNLLILVQQDIIVGGKMRNQVNKNSLLRK